MYCEEEGISAQKKAGEKIEREKKKKKRKGFENLSP
jgi:hypothetical protein